MKRKVYVAVNFLVVFAAFCFLLKIAEIDNITGIKIHTDKFYLVFIVILLFAAIHMVKMIRFYLILMENRIKGKRFIKLYIKTTFVNTTLPLKTGELFRMYCFGQEFDNYKIGILSVLIDRFFDTCGLLIILIPCEAVLLKKYSIVVFLLFIFLLLAASAYLLFPSTYCYLNRYLILNGSSKGVIKTLQLLEEVNEWFKYARHLLKGRSAAVFLLSCLAWVLEYFILRIISDICAFTYSVDAFDIYINAAFSGASNNLLRVYVLMGSIVFALTTLIVYGIAYVKRRKS